MELPSASKRYGKHNSDILLKCACAVASEMLKVIPSHSQWGDIKEIDALMPQFLHSWKRAATAVIACFPHHDLGGALSVCGFANETHQT